MSKYNLKDLLPEGTDVEYRDAKEADRLKNHPEGDKIKAIQAMMAKEKSMKEDKYDDMVNADDDIPAGKKKAAAFAYRKVDKGDSYEKATSHIKENYQMDGETYRRIDGVISNELKRKFIFAFEDLYDDMVEAGDEFDKEDVLDYLTIQIDETLKEGYSNQDGDKDDSPTEKETEKMRMKEGDSIVDEREFDFFTAILDGRYKEEDIEDYLKSDDYQAAQDEFKLDDTYTSDWVQEFANYFESRMDEGLKEHFQRFLKDYQ